jgi:hypothetical protein
MSEFSGISRRLAERFQRSFINSLNVSRNQNVASKETYLAPFLADAFMEESQGFIQSDFRFPRSQVQER